MKTSKVVSALLLAWAVLFVVACKTLETPTAQPVAYQSVWSQLYPATLNQSANAETLMGGFKYAAATQSLTGARSRWTAFLGEWRPQNGQFEDGLHARLVTWAELEMRRVHLLESGDLAGASQVDDELRNLAKEME